jgi:beta-aspartyl-dipeptidase (metallo-type)
VPPSRFTTAGITTVIGLLGTDDVARGPRELLATVYALREEGLNAYAYAGGYHVPPATLTGSVRSDLVLVEALVGIGEVAISDHRSSQPTLDELLRLAADAHVAGLQTNKAGILHLHLGDGSRGLSLVREALAQSELPPRVFNPTHVNRRRALFDEAVDLARQGSSIDITAFPVDEGEDAYDAAEALQRYLASGAPPERVTVSSDAGGCLPCFDADGRVCHMDVGSAGALLATLRQLVAAGMPLETALPAFTTNPAHLLRLAGKGGIVTGATRTSSRSTRQAAGRSSFAARCVTGGSVVRRHVRELDPRPACPAKFPKAQRAAGSSRSAAPRTRKTTATSSSASCAARATVTPTSSSSRPRAACTKPAPATRSSSRTSAPRA